MWSGYELLLCAGFWRVGNDFGCSEELGDGGSVGEHLAGGYRSHSGNVDVIRSEPGWMGHDDCWAEGSRRGGGCSAF